MTAVDHTLYMHVGLHNMLLHMLHVTVCVICSRGKLNIKYADDLTGQRDHLHGEFPAYQTNGVKLYGKHTNRQTVGQTDRQTRKYRCVRYIRL